MNMWIWMSMLLLMMGFVVWIIWQGSHRSAGKVSTEEDRPFLHDGMPDLSTDTTAAAPGIMPEDVWWQRLGRPDQLQLALYLIEKALPVWEKFTARQEASYRATAGGPLTIVESSLLQKAVEALILHVQLRSPGNHAIVINRYCQRFVGHILALQDGIWVCAYPVKRIFFAVYFILMSVVEQESSAANENFLTKAINTALDCLELSKLYTREEIASLLSAYRYKL